VVRDSEFFQLNYFEKLISTNEFEMEAIRKKNANKSEPKQSFLAFLEVCMTNLVAF